MSHQKRPNWSHYQLEPKSVQKEPSLLDKTSKGLFDFRKNETKKIEQYNDEESKIKTNVGQTENTPNINIKIDVIRIPIKLSL